jgi:hypothetical protein
MRLGEKEAREISTREKGLRRPRALHQCQTRCASVLQIVVSKDTKGVKKVDRDEKSGASNQITILKSCRTPRWQRAGSHGDIPGPPRCRQTDPGAVCVCRYKWSKEEVKLGLGLEVCQMRLWWLIRAHSPGPAIYFWDYRSYGGPKDLCFTSRG